MPPRTNHRWLTVLVFVFAVAAAILWVLPFSVSRHVLFPGGPVFEDIVVYKGRFALYHTTRFFTSRAYSAFAYPAGAAPIYEAFYKTANAITTYLILSLVTVIAALIAAFAFLRRRGIAKLFVPLLLLSFPLVFLIQRANIEIVLWIVIALGLIAYRRGLAIVVAFLFGLAAAVKLYPIILLGLFLRRKRDLPAFFAGLIAAIVAMGAAIAYTGPTFSLAAQGFFTGVNRFQNHYVDVVSKIEVAFDHCLFSPFKYYTYAHHASPAAWTGAYFLLAGLFALLLFLRVRTMPFLNRVLFLVVAMVSLPPVSFTYTLVHLYVPFFFLLGALATFRTRPPATAVVALVLLLFLMLPVMSLSVFQPTLPTGPFQSVALFLLLILCAFQPWPEASIAADA
jgi:hypothetical protein